MNTMTRTIPGAALVALVAAAALTGCTLSFTPNEQSEAAPASPEGATEPDVTTTDPESDTDSDSDDGPKSTSSIRAEYAGQVQSSLACAGGSIEIDTAGSVVELADDCDSLTVSGTGTIVLAQNVGALSVTGTSTVVVVASAESISADGTGNVVQWESGSPAVSDSGLANEMGPAQ